MEKQEFKSWAIVEVMGHGEYSGFVCQEVIAGVSMLRVDVPECPPRQAFTKYIAPQALYGITPCSEETATLRAKSRQSEPFAAYDVGAMVREELKKQGRLLPAPSNNFMPDPEDDREEFHGAEE